MALSERMIFFIGRSVPSGLGGVELLLSERIRTRVIFNRFEEKPIK